MPGKGFMIRFPNGDFEYDLTVLGRDIPSVGDTLRRNGVLWRVIQRAQEPGEVVYVERVEPPAPRAE